MDKFQMLRKKAEAILEKDVKTDVALQKEDIKKLIEEIEVFRIELEIQNEEIRETQSALAKSQREFYNLFEFAPIGYAVLTHDGVIRQLNQKGAELFRLSREHLINSRLNAFAFPPGIDFKRHYEQLKLHGGSRIIETEFVSKNGGKLWARLDLTLWEAESEEQSPKILCAISDISDMKSAEQELVTYRNHLENLVKHRTEALESANARLSEEIDMRKQSEKRIADSLKEKEVLIKEIHHRVKNNLQVIISMLRMHGRRIENAEVAEVFTESQNRIQAMSMIHETLYQQESFVNIDLGSYLKRLSSTLARVYSAPGLMVRIHVDIQDIHLVMDQAIPCGLIMNELISNALKYAFTPDQQDARITIAVTEGEDGLLTLMVRDNGAGLSESVKLDEPETMGLMIIFNLAEKQLNATVDVQVENGTAFLIRFKKI